MWHLVCVKTELFTEENNTEWSRVLRCLDRYLLHWTRPTMHRLARHRGTAIVCSHVQLRVHAPLWTVVAHYESLSRWPSGWIHCELTTTPWPFIGGRVMDRKGVVHCDLTEGSVRESLTTHTCLHSKRILGTSTLYLSSCAELTPRIDCRNYNEIYVHSLQYSPTNQHTVPLYIHFPSFCYLHFRSE